MGAVTVTVTVTGPWVRSRRLPRGHHPAVSGSVREPASVTLAVDEVGGHVRRSVRRWKWGADQGVACKRGAVRAMERTVNRILAERRPRSRDHRNLLTRICYRHTLPQLRCGGDRGLRRLGARTQSPSGLNDDRPGQTLARRVRLRGSGSSTNAALASDAASWILSLCLGA